MTCTGHTLLYTVREFKIKIKKMTPTFRQRVPGMVHRVYPPPPPSPVVGFIYQIRMPEPLNFCGHQM